MQPAARARRWANPDRDSAVGITPSGGAQPAGLARRLGASVYEALLLSALCLALGFALLPLVTPAALAPVGTLPAAHYALTPGARLWSGALLLAACGAYCVWQWSGGRRTLPMQAWRLELTSASGGTVAARVALVRFLACWIGPALALSAYLAPQPIGGRRVALALLAINYAWALFDPDRQFLQDRIAGTRLMRARAAKADASRA